MDKIVPTLVAISKTAYNHKFKLILFFILLYLLKKLYNLYRLLKSLGLDPINMISNR
jgi:hypothetical protein